MDKIYSRKRINVTKNSTFILIIIIVSLLTVVYIIKAVSPLFNVLCETEAKSSATLLVNNAINETMTKYGYNDLITIIRDNNGKIVSMQANIITMNKVISDISLNIQNGINSMENKDIYIRAGTFTGITLLSGKGPKIPIRISSIGNIKPELSSEFESSGFNQTIHRIYLNITCKVDVLTPFNTIGSDFNTKVILAENLIIGDIPSNYIDLTNLYKKQKDN